MTELRNSCFGSMLLYLGGHAHLGGLYRGKSPAVRTNITLIISGRTLVEAPFMGLLLAIYLGTPWGIFGGQCFSVSSHGFPCIDCWQNLDLGKFWLYCLKRAEEFNGKIGDSCALIDFF